MRTPDRVRPQTDLVATSTPPPTHRVSLEELSDLVELWAAETNNATRRTGLSGPLTPYSLEAFWLPTLTPQHRILFKKAGLDLFKQAARSREYQYLLVPPEFEQLADTADTEERFLSLWAAKVLVENAPVLYATITELATPNERDACQELGPNRPLFLTNERLHSAASQWVKTTTKKGLFSNDSSLLSWACENLELESSAWGKALHNALLQTLASHWRMLVCPAPRGVVIEFLENTTGMGRDQVAKILRAYPSVYQTVFGRSLALRGRGQVPGSKVVPSEVVFEALDQARELSGDSYAEVAPTVHGVRTAHGAGRIFTKLRTYLAQVGPVFSSQKLRELYADEREISAKPRYATEVKMETALKAASPSARIHHDQNLPGLPDSEVSVRRWDFRLEDQCPSGALPARLLVEVHGPTHFGTLYGADRRQRRRDFRRRRLVDDEKTRRGLEWLAAQGTSGTYLIVHHQALDLLDDGDWLTECFAAIGGNPPRWLYIRPASGQGSEDWPGFNKGADGLDPSSRRNKTVGDVELVWVR